MKYTERKKVRTFASHKRQNTFTVHLVRGVLLVVAIGLLSTGIFYSTRADAVTIRDIHVVGGETIPHELVVAKVRESLQGTYFFLIPHTFAFFYPQDEILSRVNNIPRIYGVQVHRDTLTSLAITFSEYMPHALWCVEGASKACMFIDETGYAYAEAPGLVGGALVRHTTIEDGDQLMSVASIDAAGFSQIEQFIERVERELGIRIAEVKYKDHGDLEFVVSGGGALYVTRDKDLDAQFTHLASVLSSKEFAHITPGNFNYIDIRFDTKVFVHEEPEFTATSSISTTTETF